MPCGSELSLAEHLGASDSSRRGSHGCPALYLAPRRVATGGRRPGACALAGEPISVVTTFRARTKRGGC
jgi:hypothetical protein